jgi:dipeptidase D
VDVRGLLGGHSGLDINLGRGNSIAILAEMLQEAIEAGLVLSVDTISGGNLRNAIPREASAVVRVMPGHAEDLEVVALQKLGDAQEALGDADPGLRIEVTPAEGLERTIPVAAITPFLEMLLAMPRGVLAMSADIEGLVQTSNNLAVVRDGGDHLSVQACTRSSIAAELEEARARIGAGVEAIGGCVEMDEAYPGWKPDLASPILARCIAVHERVFGHPPKVKAVHAGLECGILGRAAPGLDMVSMGPNIHHPHSPDEDVEIASVGRFYGYLKAVVADFASGT